MFEHWFFQKLSNPLVLFGFTGQCVFMLRFVIQWWASERRGRSYVPVAFWYFSLIGGLMLFIYAWNNEDPVIMFGQMLGLGIYARNLFLIHTRRARYRRRKVIGAAARRAHANPPADAARPSGDEASGMP